MPDWFRNECWDEIIEAEFRRRLARARSQKQQYLRLQACHLAKSFPDVALRLLDEYFSNGAGFDSAQAWCDRATALQALGRVEDAVTAYGAALDEEQRQPRFLTQAGVELARLVADAGLTSHYAAALAILEQREPTIFPLERYRAAGARAIMLAHFGRNAEARAAAREALASAAARHSGFRYHPNLGLVDTSGDRFGQKVAELAR